MTATQPDLFSQAAPEATPEEVSLFIALLSGRDWQTAAQITALAITTHGQIWKDRQIRALASASQGQIISGQKGYRLTKEASLEEIQHAANWLRHQGQAMIQRSVDIERVRHGKATP